MLGTIGNEGCSLLHRLWTLPLGLDDDHRHHFLSLLALAAVHAILCGVHREWIFKASLETQSNQAMGVVRTAVEYLACARAPCLPAARLCFPSSFCTLVNTMWRMSGGYLASTLVEHICPLHRELCTCRCTCPNGSDFM